MYFEVICPNTKECRPCWDIKFMALIYGILSILWNPLVLYLGYLQLRVCLKTATIAALRFCLKANSYFHMSVVVSPLWSWRVRRYYRLFQQFGTYCFMFATLFSHVIQSSATHKGALFFLLLLLIVAIVFWSAHVGNVSVSVSLIVTCAYVAQCVLFASSLHLVFSLRLSVHNWKKYTVYEVISVDDYKRSQMCIFMVLYLCVCLYS